MGQRVSRVAAAVMAALLSLSAFASDGKTLEKARIRRGSKVKLSVEHVAAPQKAVFSGEILGQSNPLPAVSIIVRNEATRAEFTAVTDAEGKFTIPSLDDGLYRVEAKLQGFRAAVIEHLELKASEVTRARIAMRIDSAQWESITTGCASVEPWTSSTISTTFTQDLINKLPI